MLIRNRVPTLYAILLASTLFGLSSIGIALSSASAESGDRPDNVIRISGQFLGTPLLRIAAGETVAWVSGSATPSLIVFKDHVVDEMKCDGLAGFEVSEGELVHAIGYDETVSFCALSPGRYRYKIYRPDVTLGNRAGARRLLYGAILVE